MGRGLYQGIIAIDRGFWITFNFIPSGNNLKSVFVLSFFFGGGCSYTTNHVYAKSLKYVPPHVHVCYR